MDTKSAFFFGMLKTIYETSVIYCIFFFFFCLNPPSPASMVILTLIAFFSMDFVHLGKHSRLCHRTGRIMTNYLKSPSASAHAIPNCPSEWKFSMQKWTRSIPSVISHCGTELNEQSLSCSYVPPIWHGFPQGA